MWRTFLFFYDECAYYLYKDMLSLRYISFYHSFAWQRLMSNRLLVFNCSTDMALASGLDNYTPPPMIQCMERELELLPVWWADDGDVVLVSDIDRAVRFTDEVNARLEVNGLTQKYIRFADWKGRMSDKSVKWNELQPVPWGWNLSLARRLTRLGISPDAMPASDSLGKMRQFSNRCFAVNYINELFANILSDDDSNRFGNRLIGKDMAYTGDWDELVRKAHQLLAEGSCILKAPWSSSGKGNLVVDEMDGSVVSWAKAVMMKQGGLCLDRFYDKRLDFAMEFYLSRDGFCTFLGYSLFKADAVGKYERNVVASQEQILHNIVSSGADPKLLERLVSYHQHHLLSSFGCDYEGMVGIDMLLADVGGRICLHPCIEINLRMNMGVVALKLERQRIPDFYLTPSDNPHFRARLLNGSFFIEKTR